MKSSRICFLQLIFILVFCLTGQSLALWVSSPEEFQKALKDKHITYISLAEGTYYGNFVLKRGNVAIEAMGKVTIIPTDSSKPALSILGSRLPLCRLSNVNISGITFEGKNTTSIFIRDSRNIIIRNCSFIGVRKGIHMHGVINSAISHSNFLNCLCGIYMESGKVHNTYDINVLKNLYKGDGTFIVVFVGNYLGKGYLNIKSNNIKVGEKYIPIGIEIVRNRSLRINWANNNFDPAYIIPILKSTDKRYLLKNLYQQFVALICMRNNILEVLQKFSVPGDYEPDNSSYEKRVLFAEKYINDSMQLSPDEIEKNLGDIVRAIYDLMDVPFNANQNMREALFTKEYIKHFWNKNNNFFTNYILPIILYTRSPECFFSPLEIKDLTIDGHPPGYYVPDIPTIRIEVFKDNMIKYKNYRENVEKARKYLDNLIYIANRNGFNIQNLILLKKLKDSIDKNWPSIEKGVRILLFDIPLFAIMAEVVNNAKYYGIKNLGYDIASFGPIAYYGIVGDATHEAWKYYLVDSMKRSMSGSEFKEFREKMKQIPLWFKDIGRKLIEETY